jgi:hypothetical protein
MKGRFFLAWVVVFIVWMLGGYVVHGTLLKADYGGLPNLFRPEAEAQRYIPLMILAHVLMAGALVWIYSRGIEPKPWLPQGIRFGIAVALLTVVPTYTIYYVVQPLPGSLVIKQMLFDGIVLLILGAVAAFFYRQESASA